MMSKRRKLYHQQHGPDCACWDCVVALEQAVRQNAMRRLTINEQIDLLALRVCEHDDVQLMPVLATLQWLRENETVIRHRLAE